MTPEWWTVLLAVLEVVRVVIRIALSALAVYLMLKEYRTTKEKSTLAWAILVISWLF